MRLGVLARETRAIPNYGPALAIKRGGISMFSRWSKTMGVMAFAVVVYGVITNLPDIKRYVKISMM